MSSSGIAVRLIAILSAVAADGAGAHPLFVEPGALEVELKGPISSLIDEKKERRTYEFELTAAGASIDVGVRPRGNSRLRVCSFPPLRLDFEEHPVAGTLFDGQRRLKLVTHCTTAKRDAGNVFDEYLAYRIFSLLSDVSYRVRLLKLSYIDTDGRFPPAPAEHYGFFIESEQALAERTASDVAEVEGIVLARLDARQAALVYVFQYLIGNTDWSLVTAFGEEFCCHNVDVLANGDRHVIVPYDFDLSGLVNASYAKPDSSLPIRSVTTRRYRGYCISPSELLAALRRITSLRPEILELAQTVPASDARDLEKRVRFIDGFFDKAGDEQRLVESFNKKCL